MGADAAVPRFDRGHAGDGIPAAGQPEGSGDSDAGGADNLLLPLHAQLHPLRQEDTQEVLLVHTLLIPSSSSQHVALDLEAQLLEVALQPLDRRCALPLLGEDGSRHFLLEATDGGQQAFVAFDAVLALSLHHLLRLQDLLSEVGHHKGHYFITGSLLVLQLSARFCDHAQQFVTGLVPACLELAAQHCHSVHFYCLVLLLYRLYEVLPNCSDFLALLCDFLRHLSFQIGGPEFRCFLGPLNFFLGATRLFLEFLDFRQHSLVQFPLLLEAIAELLLQLQKTLFERQQGSHLPPLLRLTLQRQVPLQLFAG